MMSCLVIVIVIIIDIFELASNSCKEIELANRKTTKETNETKSN